MATDSNQKQDAPVEPEENSPEGATFAVSSDDPLSVQQRGGIAADAGNEGKAGLLSTDDNTAGLVSPEGSPGGTVGDTKSRVGATAPQVEMTDIGIADTNIAGTDVTENDDQQATGDAAVAQDSSNDDSG